MKPGLYIATKGENKLVGSVFGGHLGPLFRVGDCGVAVFATEDMEKEGWEFTPHIEVPKGAWAVVADAQCLEYVKWPKHPTMDPWAARNGKRIGDEEIHSILASGGRVVREGVSDGG